MIIIINVKIKPNKEGHRSNVLEVFTGVVEEKKMKEFDFWKILFLIYFV